MLHWLVNNKILIIFVFDNIINFLSIGPLILSLKKIMNLTKDLF